MDHTHQRTGSISNAHVGAAFEKLAQNHFEQKGSSLSRSFGVKLGLKTKKQHCFDLGSENPPTLVECKSHTWTKGEKVPSAKMTTWNEAMYYFHLAPNKYRKIFFVLHHKRGGSGESLVAYYKRTYAHLIPNDVEFIEYDEQTKQVIESPEL